MREWRVYDLRDKVVLITGGFNGLFPSLTTQVLGLVNRALPDADGVGTVRVRGADSESSVAPSPLTALGYRAAAKSDELG